MDEEQKNQENIVEPTPQPTTTDQTSPLNTADVAQTPQPVTSVPSLNSNPQQSFGATATNSAPIMGSFEDITNTQKVEPIQLLDQSEPIISKKWKVYLFANVIFLAITVIGSALYMSYLSSLSKQGVSGTEFMAMLLIPIWLFVGFLSLINVIVIPSFIRRKKPKGKWLVLSLGLLVPSILVVLYVLYSIIGTVVGISSINSKREATKVQTQTAITEAKPKEITVAEATTLLNSCALNGFYYTKQNSSANGENAEATSTGIAVFYIKGSPYRIHIADRLIPQMVPIARQAQKKCTNLQFWHDGYYEQFQNGKWTFKGQVVN